MSKIESNIQLPTVVLGALIAIMVERAITLLFYVPVSNYVQDLASHYQQQAMTEPDKVPWWVQNLVLNGLLSQVLLLLAVLVFAVAFYFFVVRDRKVSKWLKLDARKAAREAKLAAKQAEVKKAAPAKKPAAKKKPAARKKSSK